MVEQPAGALALYASMAVLLILRAALAAPGSMAGWGFSLQRFAPLALAWSLWAMAALLLVPPIARFCASALGRVALPAGLGAAAFALALATMVWAWPDRLHFVGDFLLREGTAARALKPSGLFPQALPLDVFLHYGLPRSLVESWGIQTATTERALGALEAAGLALLGLAFARALGTTGTRAAAVAAVATLGGFLGLYTGYGKAIAEMTVLTLAAGVFALRALESPRWLGALGLTVATGFILHRSAVALLPVALLAAVLTLRAHPRAWRDPWVALGLVVGLVVAGAMLPRVVSTMLRFDPVHFTPLEPARSGGAFGALWAGNRPLDLINVVGLVSPLALLIPIMAIAAWRVRPTRTFWMLSTLALPWIGMTLLIHPPQGMFRDWDDYAAAGMTLSMIAAWGMAATLARAPSWRWLGLAAAAMAIGPSMQWLALNADLDLGLARIEAYLAEPPRRSDAERSRVWDFLGIRNAQLGRWDASADAMARAAEISPSPRVLLQWALAEQARGRSAVARDVFRRVTEIQPGDARAWYGLAAESWNLGDYDESRRAALRLAQVSPGSPEARQLLLSLEKVRNADGTSARP